MVRLPEDDIMEGIETAVKKVSAKDKRKKYVFSAIAVIAAILIAFFLIQLIPEALPPPPPVVCNNGLHDSGEMGVDCGGNCFAECLNGQSQGYTVPSSVYDVAVDNRDRIYVVDNARDRILIYSPELEYLRNIGETGVSPGGGGSMQFSSPYAVGISPVNGNVYVTDRFNRRIQAFDSELKLVRTITQRAFDLDWILFDLSFTPDGKPVTVSDRKSTVYVIGEIVVEKNTSVGLKGPEGVEVAPDGRIFVADSGNNTVKVFDSGLNPIATVGSGKGSGNGEFRWPTGIAIDRQGNIYVADSENDRIQIFNPDYSFKRVLLSDFSKPKKVAVDSKGRLIVADTGNNKVKVFDQSLNLVGTIDGIGWEQYGKLYFNPKYIAVGPDDKIYLTSETNQRIVVLDPDFKYLDAIGQRMGSGNNDFFNPRDLFVDDGGKIYVADKDNHRVQVFDSSFNYLMTVGNGRGSEEGEFNDVRAVAVDSEGRIFVTDKGNDRLQVFDSGGDFIKAFESNADYQFVEPVPVAVDGEDNIYVGNSKAPTVLMFDSGLNFVKTIEVGSDIEEMEGGLKVDSEGRLVLVDIENYLVKIFDIEAEENVKTIGGYGTQPGTFSWPMGMAITGDGRIVVVDWGNYRLQVFDSELNYIETIDGGQDQEIETAG